MARFEIKGKGRETGRRRKRVFEAENEQQARVLAEAEGFVVESAARLPDEPPKKTDSPARAASRKTRPVVRKVRPKQSTAKAPKLAATGREATSSDEPGAAVRIDSPPESPRAPTAPNDAAEPSTRLSPPIASPPPREPVLPWLGLRDARAGCLPVLVGAIGIGVLLLL